VAARCRPVICFTEMSSRCHAGVTEGLQRVFGHGDACCAGEDLLSAVPLLRAHPRQRVSHVWARALRHRWALGRCPPSSTPLHERYHLWRVFAHNSRRDH
jgi:hypothetical protein